MVPTVDQDGNTIVVGGNTATVNNDVLSGQTAIADDPFTDAANAQGIASTQRHFVPVNAPDDAGGIDYGTAAQNMTANRTECFNMIGTDSNNSDREIGVTVYGN
jgi:hypothetical protein